MTANKYDRTAMGEYIGQPLTSLAIPTPSPLDYNPKLLKSGIKYSILGKRSTKMEDNAIVGPGPSKYNVRSIETNFDHAPALDIVLNSNGVCCLLAFLYQVANDDFVNVPLGSESKSDFGKEARAAMISGWFDLTKESFPSPDSYYPKPDGTGPKYTFGVRDERVDSPTPGPLDYDIAKLFEKYKIGPSYTIGSRAKEKETKEQRPGPNIYYPKLELSEKKASLKGHYKDIPSLNVPSPANYIMPPSLFNGPQYSLTGRNIPFQEEQYIILSPGPAAYDLKTKGVFSKPPAISLGGRRKPLKDPAEHFPGPGEYEPKDRRINGNDAPKVTLKGRYKSKIEPTPGPASYDVAAADSKLKPSHNVRPKENQRSLFDPVECTPGPSDYSQISLSVIKPSGPAYSLRKRVEFNAKDSTPSPTAYSATIEEKKPKISIKSRSSPYVLVFPTERLDTLRI